MSDAAAQSLTPAFYDKNPARHCLELTRPGPRNEVAWAALIDRLDKFFANHARSWGLNDDEIDDIMQDTLLQFMKDIASGKFVCQGYKPITYVGTICRHLHLSYQKKLKKQQPFTDDLSLYVGEHDEQQARMLPEPTDTAPGDDCAKWAVKKALDAQPKEHQDLLWSFYVEGMLLKEYASLKDLSDKYVRVKKHRYMEPFREAFRTYFNDCLAHE